MLNLPTHLSSFMSQVLPCTVASIVVISSDIHVYVLELMMEADVNSEIYSQKQNPNGLVI